jgi:hypothetical protein
MNLKKPRFYMDRSGKFGDVVVDMRYNRMDGKGRPVNYTQLTYKENLLLSLDVATLHLELFACNNPDEVDILNEAFMQIDHFRGLLIISQNEQRFLIVEGQKVPFTPGLEIIIFHGDYLVSRPWNAAS